MSDDDAKAGSTNSQRPVWLLDPYEVPIELRWRWLGPVTAADHPRFTGALRRPYQRHRPFQGFTASKLFSVISTGYISVKAQI